MEDAVINFVFVSEPAIEYVKMLEKWALSYGENIPKKTIGEIAGYGVKALIPFCLTPDK